ncbi:MAG: TRAP transporter substrate-binding protein [Oscillospiraceae bacterium]|nr:TRAP transporter substrate-binding protein [Oscillospiraceae bacterium]
MKTRKITFIALILVLAIAATACGPATPAVPAAPAAPAAETPAADAGDVIEGVEAATFILANASPDDTVTGLLSHEFARLVGEISGGAMVIDVFPNSQLGGDAEIFTNVGVGEIDFIVGTTAPQVPTIPNLAIFDLPVAFPTPALARRVLDDDAYMNFIRAEYEVAGYKLFGMADQGFRVMSSNIAIRSMSDFGGVRIRTMENPYHLAFWTALGASPAPMAFAEVFIALQQGTIDAQENPHEVIVANAFYEVQNYIIHTNHLLHTITLVMNNPRFQSLSPEQQQVLEQAAATVIPWARQQADARVQDRVDTIAASGSEVIEIPADLMAEMLEAARPVYDMIRDVVGENLYGALMDSIERNS